jgi:hypothetical protein
MPFPSALDSKIRNRFEDLLTQSEQLLQDMLQAEEQSRRDDGVSGFIYLGVHHSLPERYFDLRTQFLSLIHLLSTGANFHLSQIYERAKSLSNDSYDLKELRGYMKALKADYEAGILENLSQMIEANVAADYLGQAEQLLKEGGSGKYDHVPSAVLTGAILEDALRRLCLRQNPPIAVNKPNGEPKTLNPLIDDLKKANVFNELKAKQLRSWADIRNAAAHGEFTQFNRQDVEQMLKGVQNFLADYL